MRAGRTWSARRAREARAADGDQALGLVPRADLDVGSAERPSGDEAAGDDAVRDGRREAEEVAAKVDCEPASRARMLECVPPRGVDARREHAPVEERARLVAAERALRRLEAE